MDFGESLNQKYMLRNTASDGELDDSDDLSLRTGFYSVSRDLGKMAKNFKKIDRIFVTFKKNF